MTDAENPRPGDFPGWVEGEQSCVFVPIGDHAVNPYNYGRVCSAADQRRC